MQIAIKRFKFQSGDFIIADAIDEEGKRLVITGNLHNAKLDAVYDLELERTEHPKYGVQWQITEKHSGGKIEPADIKTYLMSGAIIGCGPSTGQKIYDMFGKDSLRIIREEHERLLEVPGISTKKALQIHDGEAKVSPESGLMGIPGMTASRARKLHKQYGENAFKVMQDTPYQPIYDIKGFSFKTVDSMALNGHLVKKDAEQRIAAALTFILTDIEKDGHCYCGKPKLLEKAEELLGVEKEKIEKVLQDEIDKGNIILESRSVYAKHVYETECETAEYVKELMSRSAGLNVQQIAQAVTANTLVQEQIDAVTGALSNNIYGITGGAGTGKTTVINEIAKIWKNLTGKRVVMCAPTGKAARRMEEVTGCKAMTSARLTFVEREHPSNALIICDESSMLDIYMAHDLVKLAVEGKNSIVFVGDVHQLPPIGAGTFFKDVLECVPSKKLLICHRQFGTIAENADKINHGEKLSSMTFDDTSKFISATDNLTDKAIDEYKKAVAQYGIKGVCLLMPFRQARGSIPCTETANTILRKAYNPNTPENGCKFAEGDRVINLTNDPENDIANGDVGTVLVSSKEDNIFKVEMDSGRVVTYTHEGEYQFELAYALTIHKSQGSEYDCVIIVLTVAAFIMLERNLVYTAVTRGKKQVIMMGEKKAYGMAIGKNQATKRNTKLATRIKGEM